MMSRLLFSLMKVAPQPVKSFLVPYRIWIEE
jgi:hypothetical protein